MDLMRFWGGGVRCWVRSSGRSHGSDVDVCGICIVCGVVYVVYKSFFGGGRGGVRDADAKVRG